MSRLPVSLAAAAAALGLTMITTTALANPASHAAHAVEVEYGDLDLASAAGAATLYRRIQAAARDVCDSTNTRDLNARRQAVECVSQAVAGAVMRIDRETLSAVHRARTVRLQRA